MLLIWTGIFLSVDASGPDLGVYFHRPQSERGIEKSEVNMWSKQWKGLEFYSNF